MSISIQDIQNEIKGFKQRIEKARAELAGLPEGYLPYQEHKRRERIRREGEAEIEHCKQLVLYGMEGIELRESGKC